MAELVDCIVAGTQITGQLCNAINLFRSLWDQVERAPREIQDLAEEVNVLGQVLAAIEAASGLDELDFAQYNSPSMDHITKHCRNASKALLEVIGDLHRKLKESRGIKRTLVGFAMVWKKNEINHLEKKLARSLSLLQVCIGSTLLSQAIFAEALPLLQQTQNLAKERRSSPKNDTDLSSTQGLCRPEIPVNIVKPARRCLKTCLRTPSWLSSLALEIEMVVASSNLLQFNFRHFNYRHSKYELYSLVNVGDMAGILAMFSRREASPFDRDERGRSLLYYAAGASQTSVCKELTAMGLDWYIDEQLGKYLTPRQLALSRPLLHCRDKVRALELMDLFQGFEVDSTPEEDCRFLIYGCSVETNDLYLIKQFQKRAAPLYFTLSDIQRYQAIRAYCFSGYDSPHPDAGVFRFLLCDDKPLQPTNVERSSRGGFSLLHSAAVAYGRACRSIQTAILKSKADELRWRPLLTQIIEHAANADILHFVERIRHEYSISTPDLISHEEWNSTPLLMLLKGCYMDEYYGESGGISSIRKLFKEHQIVVQRALHRWLDVLALSGVDLARYGQHEKSFFANNSSNFKFALRYSRWRAAEQNFLRESLSVRLRRLEFGSRPEEWDIGWEIDIDSERLAGEFWKAVEKETDLYISIHGAWPV